MKFLLVFCVFVVLWIPNQSQVTEKPLPALADWKFERFWWPKSSPIEAVFVLDTHVESLTEYACLRSSFDRIIKNLNTNNPLGMPNGTRIAVVTVADQAVLALGLNTNITNIIQASKFAGSVTENPIHKGLNLAERIFKNSPRTDAVNLLFCFFASETLADTAPVTARLKALGVETTIVALQDQVSTSQVLSIASLIQPAHVIGASSYCEIVGTVIAATISPP